MPTLFCRLPMEPKTFSVVTVKLTDDQVIRLASEVTDNARVYFDSEANNGGPRQWPSYEAFLGFHIANAALVYQLDPAQLQLLVTAVYDSEGPTCLDDRKRREGRFPALPEHIKATTDPTPRPWVYGFYSGRYHYWTRLDVATGKHVWQVTPPTDKPGEAAQPPSMESSGYFNRDSLRRLKGDLPR